MPLEAHAPPVLQGYALRLCPAEPAATQLTAAINAMAERESTPSFRPHLTLLGAMAGPEALRIAQVERLALRLQPVPLPVTAVTARPDYFRGGVLEVALTAELRRAHELARELLQYADGGAYRPHLSVVYGALPLLRKAELTAELAHLAGLALTGEYLELVALDGPPDAWQIVFQAKLG